MRYIASASLLRIDSIPRLLAVPTDPRSAPGMLPLEATFGEMLDSEVDLLWYSALNRVRWMVAQVPLRPSHLRPGTSILVRR